MNVFFLRCVRLNSIIRSSTRIFFKRGNQTVSILFCWTKLNLQFKQKTVNERCQIQLEVTFVKHFFYNNQTAEVYSEYSTVLTFLLVFTTDRIRTDEI